MFSPVSIWSRLKQSLVDSRTRTNSVGDGHRRRLHTQTLESRFALTVSLVMDYSFDTQGFFTDPARRDAIEDVAAAISNQLNDSFDAIAPSGGNTWSQGFFHPGTGTYSTYVSNPTVPADQFIIYAGGRELGSSLGRGGPGGFSASGNTSWFNQIRQRGQIGVATDTDFAAWGGSITFDLVGTNWYFDEDIAGIGTGQFDFRSVAYHELLHAIGFGTSDSFDALVSDQEFTGPQAVAEYDLSGNVPLHTDLAHFAIGTSDGGQEAAMDPNIASGTRKYPTALDWAAMADIGWEISTGPVQYSGNDLVITGTNHVDLIEVRTAAGSNVQILINGIDYGEWSVPIGNLVVSALAGNDEVRFEPTVNVPSIIHGGTGNDFLRGGQAVDTIYGGPGNDRLYGRDGADRLFGENGNDRLFGMNGNDVLDGGSGDDYLNGAAGADELRGGPQDDRLYGAGGNDTLIGDSGNDNLVGGDGDDNLDGGSGDDELRGGNGDDIMVGGTGSDTMYGGADDDTINGNQGIDFIFGNGGNDFLYGDAENDEINAGSGDDYVEGGHGDDRILGAGGNDELRGGSGNDYLNGGRGNDQLFGEADNDDLYGSLDDDLLTGGNGLDLLHGGPGFDTAIDGGERGEFQLEA